MKDKIALEEHVSTLENNQRRDSRNRLEFARKDYVEDVANRLIDISLRLKEMDRCGVETMILSLVSPGAQSIPDSKEAVEFCRHTNDLLTETYVRRHGGRFYAFATVPLQDPHAAADELERAVTELGMKGALVNGYTNLGEGEQVQYLDEQPVWEFWERAAELDVPVYLHPRTPLPSQRRIYDGYPELIASAWGFGHETGTHAVRLMLSGLFDKFPDLTVILGHLGEGLPQLLPRLQSRLFKQGVKGRAAKTVGEYFTRNFYVTTSGHFHTKALLNCIAEIGSDHVMFSADYPFEDVESASTWFDSALISDNDRRNIGRENARRLFGIS